MASPIFLSKPPKSFNTLALVRGSQLAFFSLYQSIRNSSADELLRIMITSLILTLLSNVPTMALSVFMYTLSLVNIVSEKTEHWLVNYYIDYQCHVLDLMTLSFILILIIFPSIIRKFDLSITNASHKMGERFQSFSYNEVLPKNTSKPIFIRTYLESIYQIINKLSKKISLPLVKEINFTDFIISYVSDTLILTLIHILSHLPYIGPFITPIITFSSTYQICGSFISLIGALVSIPSILPSFVIPAAPRRFLSPFKNPTSGPETVGETRFANILPLVIFLTTSRLFKLFSSVYLNKLPMNKSQTDQWYRSRFGILYGYITTIYIISSILGPLGFLAVFMGIVGMSQLIVSTTSVPPLLTSISQKITVKNDSTASLGVDENIEQRSNSNLRLADMNRLGEWIQKEITMSMNKRQYLQDIIDNF